MAQSIASLIPPAWREDLLARVPPAIWASIDASLAAEPFVPARARVFRPLALVGPPEDVKVIWPSRAPWRNNNTGLAFAEAPSASPSDATLVMWAALEACAATEAARAKALARGAPSSSSSSSSARPAAVGAQAGGAVSGVGWNTWERLAREEKVLLLPVCPTVPRRKGATHEDIGWGVVFSACVETVVARRRAAGRGEPVVLAFGAWLSKVVEGISDEVMLVRGKHPRQAPEDFATGQAFRFVNDTLEALGETRVAWVRRRC